MVIDLMVLADAGDESALVQRSFRTAIDVRRRATLVRSIPISLQILKESDEN